MVFFVITYKLINLYIIYNPPFFLFSDLNTKRVPDNYRHFLSKSQ